MRAGELMQELAGDATHSAELAEVIAWTTEHLGRFTAARRAMRLRSPGVSRARS